MGMVTRERPQRTEKKIRKKGYICDEGDARKGGASVKD